MRIAAKHSHLNGLEFLMIHKPVLWDEIINVITSLDAALCRTKVSKEARTKDKLLYAPKLLNAAMSRSFAAHGWTERRTNY